VQAGTPTAAPNCNLVTISPDRNDNVHVVVPYDRIYEVGEVHNTDPKAYIQIPVFHGWKLRRETSGSTDRTNPTKSPIGVNG